MTVQTILSTVLLCVASGALLVRTPAARAEDVPSQGMLVDHSQFAGRLVDIDSTWTLTFQHDETRRDVGVSELVRWGDFVDARGGELVILADGGELVSQDPLRIGFGVLLQDRDLVIQAEPFGKLRLNVAKVRGIVLRMPARLAGRDRIVQRLRMADVPEDSLLLDDGDVIRGTLETIDEEFATLAIGEQEVRVDLQRVIAFIFAGPPWTPPVPREPFAMLGFRNGSRLFLRSIDGTGAPHVFVTLDGLRLTASSTKWIAATAAIQIVNGAVTYVSDLTPRGYKHIPFLRQSWPLGRDETVLGNWARKDNAVHVKSLGMHGTARVAFALGGQYRHFQAELAVDDATRGGGSVIFRVYLSTDGQQWEPAFESAVIRGTDPPQSISVPVERARFMTLIVDRADRGDVLDHANWLDARLVP